MSDLQIHRGTARGVPDYSDSGPTEADHEKRRLWVAGLGGGGRLYADQEIPGRYWLEGAGRDYKIDVVSGADGVSTTTTPPTPGQFSNGFIVTGPDGTRYGLGTTPDSRQDGQIRVDTSGGVPGAVNTETKTVTFAWRVAWVESLTGQRVDYTYVRDQGQVYLSQDNVGSRL